MDGTSKPTGVSTTEDVLGAICPGRKIEGMAAALLPFDERDRPDWDALAAEIRWISDCGLTPAVNMDTGYVHLLSPQDRRTVLEVVTQAIPGRPFVAGAFVEGEKEPLRAYIREIESIESRGGRAILFQCSALKTVAEEKVAEVYRTAAAQSRGLLAFELGEVFAPFGRVYELETFERILEIEKIQGLKHSSLNRRQEWERLRIRDRVRPDFKIYTGNDLAIDMVMYGSDYLLGLAAFAPDAFALRDRLWEAGSPEFFGVNDLLQYLGSFGFRRPVPAYRHSAAQFLHLRGQLPSNRPHPRAARRPDSDVGILADIAERLDAMIQRLG